MKDKITKIVSTTIEAVKFVAVFCAPHTLVAKLGAALAALTKLNKPKKK